MTVRQATIRDLDLVLPLFDAYRQFYRKQTDLALAKKFLSERFRKDASIIFVATAEGGAALGFVQLFPSFSSGSAARILILNFTSSAGAGEVIRAARVSKRTKSSGS